MNISMPVVPSGAHWPSDIPTCTLMLVQKKDGGEVSTVIIAEDHGNVLWFDEDSIRHSDQAYLRKQYRLIRKYEKGDTLTVTV